MNHKVTSVAEIAPLSSTVSLNTFVLLVVEEFTRRYGTVGILSDGITGINSSAIGVIVSSIFLTLIVWLADMSGGHKATDGISFIICIREWLTGIIAHF